jgi:hypothetical protein
MRIAIRADQRGDSDSLAADIAHEVTQDGKTATTSILLILSCARAGTIAATSDRSPHKGQIRWISA